MHSEPDEHAASFGTELPKAVLTDFTSQSELQLSENRQRLQGIQRESNGLRLRDNTNSEQLSVSSDPRHRAHHSSFRKMVFYEPGKTPHGLPRDPFKVLRMVLDCPNRRYTNFSIKACVTPRPIGWISTRNPQSKTDNLAPFSQFNNLTFDPPYIMFASNQDMNGNRKDSVRNVELSGQFCWNLATWELREKVNASAEWVAEEVDEFERCGLEKEMVSFLRMGEEEGKGS